MRNRMRAVIRPTGGGVASCNSHLWAAMDSVTPTANGTDNDTHMVVRRLGHLHELDCQVPTRMSAHRAAWVLVPQAVLR